MAQPGTGVLTHVLALARAVPASVLLDVAAQIEQHTEDVSPKGVCGYPSSHAPTLVASTERSPREERRPAGNWKTTKGPRGSLTNYTHLPQPHPHRGLTLALHILSKPCADLHAGADTGHGSEVRPMGLLRDC